MRADEVIEPLAIIRGLLADSNPAAPIFRFGGILTLLLSMS